MGNINLKKIIKFFLRNESPEKLSKISAMWSYFVKRLKVLFILKVEGVDNLKKRYAKFHGENWVILHYQRVIDPRTIPIPISTSSYVTPRTFEMHCRELARVGNIISLAELCNILEGGSSPEPGTIVITFDGGFNDFLLNASHPLLENKLHASIALKTGYIGSKAFLMGDQIATSIMLFSSTGSKLEPLENIDQQINNSIQQTLKDGIPTLKTVSTCISLLLACDSKTKVSILSSIGKQLATLEIDIPPWQDFITWHDVHSLHTLGFSFIDNLHSEVILPPLDREVVSREISESQKLFDIHGIPYAPVLSLPYGLFTSQNVIDLGKEGIKYCLGNHLAPTYYSQTEAVTKVFKRVTICEGNSLTKDLFYNQIWDIS